MEHYTAALDYRHMIAGIGLDSNEKDRPPMLFDEVFTRARADGFRITSHCDVGESYPLEHIYQVLLQIGESGADRIDHGLNAVSNPDLVKLIRDKNVGMTVCPWSYIVHQPFEEVFRRIRVLFNAGIKISIGSDDPAFMEDAWLLENLLLVKKFCKFTDSEISKLTEDAVQMCWAPDYIKAEIMKELHGMALTQKA
jgi:adenosine deaminase